MDIELASFLLSSRGSAISECHQLGTKSSIESLWRKNSQIVERSSESVAALWSAGLYGDESLCLGLQALSEFTGSV